MRLIEEDEGINELNGETDTTPDERRSEVNSTYRKETLNECTIRVLKEARNLLDDVIKLEASRKVDTVIPTTKQILWEYTGKPMLIGGITGVLFTALIVCLLYLLRAA